MAAVQCCPLHLICQLRPALLGPACPALLIGLAQPSLVRPSTWHPFNRLIRMTATPYLNMPPALTCTFHPFAYLNMPTALTCTFHPFGSQSGPGLELGHRTVGWMRGTAPWGGRGALHRGVDEGHCTVGVVTIRDLAGMEGG